MKKESKRSTFHLIKEKNKKVKTALTIAGSDPSGGAGIQEDLKVFTELGLHGLSVITTVTVQSSFGIRDAVSVEPGLIEDQLQCLMEDTEPQAAKTGLLLEESLPVVADFVKKAGFPVVVDTVFAAGSGLELAEKKTVETYRKEIIPLGVIVTPNIPETETLLDMVIVDSRILEGAARELIKMGANAVLIKGGHLDEEEVVDFFMDRSETRRFVKQRRGFKRVHGTGCTLSAAITAFLARGSSLADAVASAEAYIDRKLSDLIYPGKGTPVINHLP
ncbi:bifunctional hydroxymethylpyrimidine kinase/phosphomethylpyrimidine kinase [candidate division WOR-3 bacterium]|uniref:hydroxymethylpyrimidine kinase n=1 Tax=candidate division WOR-3 bacterium TaxID=2052148 RepID=A0A9D5QDR9_UNCW3|nr:bifunctional hydroxymethylpyrimidine kinase/phosphomethylpyrimidine kinase [candidate division WOR-3 bacterium]MBD3365336.1 bifunctional hydroxymethylpyrimidine kinase/phosphomethylpyrimidine kinase [candidate division WOR-3 bacterium]